MKGGLYVLGGVIVALLATVLTQFDGCLALAVHSISAAAGSVLSLYKDFVLLKFPHGVACIIGAFYLQGPPRARGILRWRC